MRTILTAILLATSIVIAPQAHSTPNALCVSATECPWVSRLGSPDLSPVPSIDVNQPRSYPPAGAPGTWQVYATPPGTNIRPSAETFCGTTTSQALIPASCPAGWELWYR